MAGSAQYIGPALTIASSVTGFMGANKAASAARLAAERTAAAKRFEAKQLLINAGQEQAAGQRAGFEQERQAQLIQSRQIALAAASGAGASDPTIMKLIARTEKEGSYRAAVAIYGGEEKARQLRMAAAGRQYEADAAITAGAQTAQAYQIAGVGSLLRGGASLFAKYGMGGPKGSGDSAALGGPDTSWLDTGSQPMSGMA